MLSCKICQIFKDSFFIGYLRWLLLATFFGQYFNLKVQLLKISFKIKIPAVDCKHFKGNLEVDRKKIPICLNILRINISLASWIGFVSQKFRNLRKKK